MVVIRNFIGLAYILGILILAFDSLFWLFHGFVPPLFMSLIESPASILHECSNFLSMPVSWFINLLTGAIPFLGGILPVTQTDIFQAEIHWAPLLSLFIYSGLLRAFDNFVLKSRMNEIQSGYQNQPPASNTFNDKE